MDQKLILHHLLEIAGILSDIQQILYLRQDIKEAYQFADHAKQHINAIFEGVGPHNLREALLAREALFCLLEEK